MSKRKPPSGGRPGRPQVPPPALLRSEGEPFEGFDVLDEVGEEGGLLLCASLRDVMLWLATPEGERGALFPPRAHARRLREVAASELDDALKPQLRLLARVLGGEPQPTAEVAGACRGIAAWAEERDLPRTAITFGQAAALALPRSAEHALYVGRLCRRNAQYARAESWYRRAVGLARRRDAQSYGRALLGLGNLAVQRGNYPAAERAFVKALGSARRAGLRSVRAEALHDLFSLAVESRKITEAEVYARRAAKAYGKRHPRIPALANDVAFFWLAQGYFERALRVLEALTSLFPHLSARLQLISNIARAAGGAGDKSVFLDAWTKVWQIVDSRTGWECAASSALNLAYGAAHLSDWERVEVAARFAVGLAEERGEEQVRAEGEQLLDAVVVRHFLESLLPSPEDPEIVEAADALANELVRKLAACAGA